MQEKNTLFCPHHNQDSEPQNIAVEDATPDSGTAWGCHLAITSAPIHMPCWFPFFSDVVCITIKIR